jgi:signal transduction histidine kinase/CheY-like chemotaxis protein
MARKKMSLRTRAILLVALFMLATNLALGAVLLHQSRRAMKEQIDARMLDVVNTAAAMLDGDVLDRLTAADKGTPAYQAVYDTLARFLDNINLDYIYYVRDMGDGTFTFGIDPDPVAPGEFGAPVVYTDALYAASRGTPSVDDEPYEDEWGRFYSAFSPVFNSAGNVAGVVTADFSASWYENEINQNQRTILLACALFLAISIGITLFLTGQFSRQMETIRGSLSDLAEDMASLTKQSAAAGETPAPVPDMKTDDIQALGQSISGLRDRLRDYVRHTTTQANAMITAMASDYSSVYYANLDTDDCVCYRVDHSTDRPFSEGDHFSYRELFERYANNFVTDAYREGFLSFIEPDNVRAALATQPLIAYRYLARRNGREFYEMIRMAGVRRAEDRDDHIVHAVGVGLTKIDEEMRDTMAKNQALAEALAMAEEANVAKTAFLSSMSHEIRTPMNAILGLNNLALHDETLTPQTREYLTKTGDSARHLLALINDILDMSRIESGRIVLRREEFSFRGMLEQINTMVMSQCDDKGLQYECRVLGSVADYYIGDDMKLKEILINILSNAIKFTEAPGSVTLTVERTAEFEDHSTLRFRIKDTGIGMDKSYLPKIFDAFSQEDSSRKNKYGSTGLGMAITKSIVEMMNGTISVESEKGVGTEFTVVIPLRNSLRTGPAPEETVDPHSLRVLIVDDEEIVAEHGRMVLDEAGIRADVCHSGAEALNMLELHHLKQEPYNLVLMDWRMPEMDGLETTRRIRRQYSSDSLVIIMTAYTWDAIREEALAAGIDSFLAKPIFASGVVEEFERVARRDDKELFKEKQRASLEGRRILLAEDMEVNAEIMMDILSLRDAEADHAENGARALEMFSESAPGAYSAILMDVRMPVMDGLEAAAAIRALDRPDAKTIPIIALTANAFDEDVQRSLQAGMNAHLTKPVDSDHLFQTLEELIFEAEN